MSKQTGYGFFPGGDPRLFTPDEEMCTPAEIEAHNAACLAWNAAAGNKEAEPGSGYWMTDKDGKRIAHVLAPRFGMGTYEYDDGEPEEATR